MIDLFSLDQAIQDQQYRFFNKDPGIQRDIDFQKYSAHQGIVIITGIRRCGKSTLLLQFKDFYNHVSYVNFDDDRFIRFTHDDFQTLLTLLLKLNPNADVFFFDEIQNIAGWERFVRRLHDEGYKIFITGSNAHLLSSELGTHLTGRYVKIELFPFSFREILQGKKIDPSDKTTQNLALVLKEFETFLSDGGFPEFIHYQEPEFVIRTYEDILYRDIVARYGIRDVSAVKLLAHYLMTNFTREYAYTSLVQVSGLKSDTSVRNYIRFFEDAYLLFECVKYDYSLKRQFTQGKKIYAIDSGMRNAISLKFSQDIGKSFENQVYIELIRRGYEVWYFRDKGECDFIARRPGSMLAIQVCYEVTPDNFSREINGLTEALEKTGAEAGILLTMNQRTIPDYGGNMEKEIQVIPAWEWFTYLSDYCVIR